jgi:tRNA pseudouridine55 synthase
VPVYIIDKPLALTSHDVVAKARKLLGTRRVGHAGTLDPLATGVLVLLVDEATKLSPFLSESEKRYLAWISFGATTATGDAEGPVTREADPAAVTMERIAAALPPFFDLSEQRPPSYSAVKQGGVKGYEAARKGEAVEFPPRPARYFELELLAFAPQLKTLPPRFQADETGLYRPADDGRPFALPPPLGAYPTALFDLRVQAGTYVRAFARDLGEALEVPAHLAGLARTASGRLTLEQAAPLEALKGATPLAMRDVLPYPLVELSATESARIRQGQRLPLHDVKGRFGLVGPEGELIAVAEAEGEGMKLLRVWT